MKTRSLFPAAALAAAFFLATAPSIAQPPPDRMEDRREDIEAMKIGFLTKRLDLTPDEAKVFWPVYNQFTAERDKLRQSMRDSRRELREDFENRSDKEVESAVDGEIAFRQQELDLMKTYHAQFKQVLPIKKVARLYRSEEDFKRELLQRLQQRRDRDERQRRRPGYR